MSKNFSRQAGNGGRAVTMAEVARRAGVSTATVSRALTAPDKVASLTQSRVTRVIEEIGYTPNLTARNLRVQSTKMVLALTPGVLSAFFAPIVSAIEDELAAAGYGLVIGDTRNQKEREVHYARLIRARQVDGAIIMTGRLPRLEDGRSIEASLPIVLVCNDIRGQSLPLISVDNRAAASTLVEYLIRMGHTKIGHITGPIDKADDARERMRGFLSAMKAAALPVPRHYVWKGNFYADSGVRAAEGFLKLRDRPTAVFAANDATAISFVRALSLAGISVPQDVSVAGFDDIENLALFIPAITTVRQPRTEMGHLAARDLLRRMGHPEQTPKPAKLRLDCELVIRDSVQKLSSAK